MKKTKARLVLVFLGGCGVLLGAAVFVGGFFHSGIFGTSLLVGDSVQTHVGLGFFFSGLAILSASFFKNPLLTFVFGIGVLCLGFLGIVEHVVSEGQAVCDPTVGNCGLGDLGRHIGMALNEALAFLVLGMGLSGMGMCGVLSKKGDKCRFLGGIAGSIIVGMGLVAIVGHVRGYGETYGWGELAQMDVVSAFGFLVLGFSLVGLVWREDEKTISRFPSWLPAASGVGCLVVTVNVWLNVVEFERAKISQLVKAKAEHVRDRVEEKYIESIVVLRRMGTYWESMGGVSKDEWRVLVEGVLEVFSGFQAIEWVDTQNTVRWVLPLKGNEKVKGLDLSFENKRKRALRKARSEGVLVETEVLDLVQGGRGVLVCVPLYSKGRFDGFLLGVFHVRRFMEHCLGPEDPLFSVAVSGNTGVLMDRMLSSDASSQQWAHTVPVRVLGKRWYLMVWPSQRFVWQQRSYAASVVFFFGAVFSFLLALVVHLLRKTRIRSREKLSIATNARKYLYRVIQSMGDLLFVLDQEGKIKTANRQVMRVLGLSQDELLGRALLTLVGPEDKQSDVKKVLVCCHRDRAMQLREDNIELKTKSGEWVPVSVSSHILEGEVGGIRGWVISARDQRDSRLVQELKTTQAQLVQSSKLASVGTLASGIAHELNNPLAAIKGFAHLIEKEASVSEVVVDQARKIIVASDRMAKISKHLRVFARESRRQDWRVVDLNDVLKDSLILMNQRMKDLDIKCVLSLDPEAIPIKGDHNLLVSVFHNLFDNSIDAFDLTQNPESSRRVISVFTARLTPERVEVVFRDNASGMSKEILDRVFEPFYTTKDVGRGTGLGLSISHGIISQHGGKITVKSQPGEGTRFRIRFPCVSTETLDKSCWNESTEIVMDENVSLGSKKMRVLVIDDEPSVCEVLTGFLEDDFEVESTTDPEMAVAWIRTRRYHIVISDLKMPRVSGKDILKVVGETQSDTPVVFVSGHSREEPLVKEALACGGAGLLTKPFDEPRRVVGYLKAVVSSSRSDEGLDFHVLAHKETRVHSP